MKDPALRHRTATRWRALVLVAMAAAVLAGCDLATGTVRTATELEKAGIDSPNLDYQRATATATLDYDADSNPLEARAEQDTAARVIWENLPFRIERIVVTSDGGAFPTRREYPRSVLEGGLGPRPANLDRSVEDIARRATLIAGVVGFVVLVLIVLVVVLVVRAVRRRPAAQPAGWPQGPAGPQPWGQPAPPGQQVPPGQQPWAQGPPPDQQPWGSQPGYGQPPSPVWPQPPSPPPPPSPAPAPQPPGRAGAGDDWPSGAPRPEGAPPPRGPGDTQRLEPEPPDDRRGPAPPVPPG